MRDRLAPDRLQAIGKNPVQESDTATRIRRKFKVCKGSDGNRDNRFRYIDLVVYRIQFVMRRLSRLPRAPLAQRIGPEQQRRTPRHPCATPACIYDIGSWWRARHAA